MCVNEMFGVVFYCWMAADGRWCCQTIFGPADVAKDMQQLEDGEQLRVVAFRDVMCLRTISADYVEVTRRLESTPIVRVKAVLG